MGLLGIYAVILAVGFGGAYGQAWIVNLFGQRVMRDIRRDVFDHIQKLHTGWFDRHPIGQVVTRATSDVDALNELLSSGRGDDHHRRGPAGRDHGGAPLDEPGAGARDLRGRPGALHRGLDLPAPDPSRLPPGAGGGRLGERLHPGDADRHGGAPALPAGAAPGLGVPEAEPGTHRRAPRHGDVLFGVLPGGGNDHRDHGGADRRLRRLPDRRRRTHRRGARRVPDVFGDVLPAHPRPDREVQHPAGRDGGLGAHRRTPRHRAGNRGRAGRAAPRAPSRGAPSRRRFVRLQRGRMGAAGHRPPDRAR